MIQRLILSNKKFKHTHGALLCIFSNIFVFDLSKAFQHPNPTKITFRDLWKLILDGTIWKFGSWRRSNSLQSKLLPFAFFYEREPKIATRLRRRDVLSVLDFEVFYLSKQRCHILLTYTFWHSVTFLEVLILVHWLWTSVEINVSTSKTQRHACVMIGMSKLDLKQRCH